MHICKTILTAWNTRSSCHTHKAGRNVHSSRSVDAAIAVVVVAGEGRVSVVLLHVQVVVRGSESGVRKLRGGGRSLDVAVRIGSVESNACGFGDLRWLVVDDASAKDVIFTAQVLEEVLLDGKGSNPRRQVCWSSCGGSVGCESTSCRVLEISSA